MLNNVYPPSASTTTFEYLKSNGLKPQTLYYELIKKVSKAIKIVSKSACILVDLISIYNTYIIYDIIKYHWPQNAVD